MVMTILEAPVEQANWPKLQEIFGVEVKTLDPGIVHTYLVQGKKDPNLWRIITVWESQEVLEQMRNSGETPRGVVMFREAKAEPSLSVFDISHQSD